MITSIAIIPARGGSQRIPRKNIKEFHGKPIIAYSIEKAFASGLFERVIVSTDDEDIAAVAMSYEAEVWMRDPAYAKDDIGTQEVVRECLMNRANPLTPHYVCCIYATSPLMDVMDLRKGYTVLTSALSVSYVMSAGYPPLQDAAQFYWGRSIDFRNSVPLITPMTRLIHVDERRVCDINTPEDWARAEAMYSALETQTA